MNDCVGASSSAQDVLVSTGGSLLPEDIAAQRAMGVDGCFPPGTNTAEIVRFIRGRSPDRRAGPRAVAQ